MQYLKQSTAATLKIGPFLDDTDGKTAETGLTIAQADVRLSKNGGDIAQKNESTSCTHDELGIYGCPVDTTDTGTLGRMQLWVHSSGALPVYHEFMIVTAEVYDTLCSTDHFTVDLADDAITSAKFDESTAFPLASADSGSTAVARTGADSDTLETLSDQMDAIVADTNELQADWTNGGRLDLILDELTAQGDTNEGKLDTIDSVADAILVDTGTDLPATLATIAGYIDTEVAAILAAVDTEIAAILEDTGTTLPAQISGLNNISSGDVETACGTALATYDPPTKAELDAAVADVSVDEIQASALADLFNTDSGTTYAAAVSGSVVKEIADNAGGSSLTESGIADAVWNEARTGHTGAGTFGLYLDAQVSTIGGGSLTAADIADAVWDEASTGHTDAGKAGAQLWTDIDAVLEDTGTTLPAALTAIDGKIDTVDGIVDDILVDTAEIGAAGAGLTEAGGTGDQLTAIPWNSSWDAEVQSECADALTAFGASTLDAAGIRTAVGLASANLDTQLSTIDGIVDDILVDTGTTLPGTLSTIAGYLDTEIAAILEDTGTTLPATLATISGYVDSLESRLTADRAGYLDNLSAGAVATAASLTTIEGKIDTMDTVADAVKVKTDQLTFTQTNELDVNVQSVNDVALTGDGSGTPWGPA